jgi:hypothetical protein
VQYLLNLHLCAMHHSQGGESGKKEGLYAVSLRYRQMNATANGEKCFIIYASDDETQLCWIRRVGRAVGGPTPYSPRVTPAEEAIQ